MPRPPILKIVEVFASVQGEGLRQGEPTIFVRFAGCNLRCPFCDTKHAWEGGAATTAAAIAARVDGLRRRFPAAWADLTGGEPFAQEIGGLIRLLRRHGGLEPPALESRPADGFAQTPGLRLRPAPPSRGG